MVSLSDNMSDRQDYQHSDPVTDQALEWFIRTEAGGEPSQEDLDQFHAWLTACPDHGPAYEQVKCLWSQPETLIASARLHDVLDTAVSDVENMEQFTTKQRFGRRYGLAAAASVLIAVGITQLVPFALTFQKADFTTVAGQISTVRLPDGSTMMLNSKSAVALDFSATSRGVRIIEGEAWFDVVHNDAAPFRVNGQFSTTTVTGTAFDVKVGDHHDTVRLERGSVYLTLQNSDITPVHLSPGQGAKATEKDISEPSPSKDDGALAWRQGRIVFTEKPLRDALATISRYSEVRIFVVNRTILDTPVSGNYRVDSAEDAIDSIVSAVGGKVSHLPGGVKIIR